MTLIDLLAGSPGAFIGTSLVLGLLVGSFLNVVIHRLPRMLDREWRAQCAEILGTADATAPTPAAAPDDAPPDRYDLVMPRSACPACATPIAARHNIPVLSWLLLRGRCAHCSAPISARYPAVEALTGVLTAAVAWHFGFGIAALLGMLLTWFLVALAFIDLDRQLLPDNLTLPLMWVGIAASLCWGGSGSWPVELRTAVLGAIAGYLSLWSVYHAFRLATGKEGMGYGDFKLLAALGAWLGYPMLLPVVLIAAGVGAVLGIALIAVQGRERSAPMPFGPFLAAAGWIALLWGPALVHRWLGLVVHAT